MKRYKPRKPTEDEKNDLRAWEVEMMGGDEECLSCLDCVHIAVFDHYCSDGPGYQGRVMVVVWPGGETYFNVYAWYDGEFTRVKHDLEPYTE